MQSQPDTILWGLVLAVYSLGLAMLVGGSACMLLVLRPSLNLLDQTQRTSVNLQTLKRFFRLVWCAMPLVLLTGLSMEAFRAGGFVHADWHVQTVQGLAILMAITFLWAFYGPFQRARRAIRPQPKTFESIRSLVGTGLAIGTAIVVVASLGHTF